jgi:sigma-B regulation protein RsbU (phosphoserine phosphatase)
MSLYTAPIVHDGERLGVIIVGTRSTNMPSRETVETIADRYDIPAEELQDAVASINFHAGGTPEAVRSFADALARTIATLYGQADRIERQLDELRTAHSFTELLSRASGLQEVLDLTVRRIVEVMPVKACAIRLLDPDTGELVIKAVHNLSDEYLKKGRVVLHENAIDTAAMAGHVVYIPDVPNDPRTRYPENARREGIASGLSAPLAYRGQTIGVIRVYTGEPYTFTETEKSLLRSIGVQVAGVIISTQLWESRARAEDLHRQAEAAATVQHHMLPTRPPQCTALKFGCVYDPSRQLGGDLYDFVEFEDKSIGLCIADVVGKGVPAALLMAAVRSIVRGHAHRSEEVARLVRNINEHLCHDTLPQEFATLTYGVFSPDRRTFTYCNAGHVPPVLLRAGRFQDLTSGGMVIGVLSGERYEQESISLEDGDVIVFVTDGVTEAMDFEGRPYGRSRLLASIRRHQALDAQQLSRQILWDVRRFAGLAEQSDDITIVVVKKT